MLKKLLSESVIYGGTHILARVVNYVLVPLHTANLATENYGIVSDYYAMAALLNVVFTYGMETAFFRFSSKKGNSPKHVFDATLTALLITTLLFSGLIIGFSQPIATGLGYAESSHFVEWFGWLIGIDTLAVIPFAWLRFKHQPMRFALLKGINIFLNVGLNFFFLWFCPLALSGELGETGQTWVQSFYDPDLGKGYIFLSNLIANGFYLPLMLPIFLQWRPRFQWSEMKVIYTYGLPLVVSGAAFAINETADRILLKYWLPEGFYEGESNLGAVGIYNACYKLSIFITLAVQGFKYAAEPFFFSQSEDKNSPHVFARVMRYFVIATVLMMLAVMANLDWIAAIFIRNKAYWVGLPVVPILLLANIFLGMFYNLSVWYKVTDRTHYGAMIGSFGALVTLVANFMLIPILGYMGSAVATLLCYISITVMSYRLGQKYFPVPYPLTVIGMYLLAGSVLSLLVHYLPIESFWLKVLTGNGIVLLSLLAVVKIELPRFLIHRGNR